ncbi:MAG: DUF262 domain-containing protein [Gammaproteobacteria bacterium]|nr:DUF262 domain-containing protein [Gammaproteobacteria bacterium]
MANGHFSDPKRAEDEEIEGLETAGGSWGDYPLDSLLIRDERRTIHDVIRRIDQKNYVMDPDFQRDFIWAEDKQSKLIESVIMRIPLPVFYLAEDHEGRMVVVDGLQRLSTFNRFVKGDLRLKLPDRKELDGQRFSDLSPKIQNRIEDCNLIFYIVDVKVPERARLDIFERVNGGVPLTRQQMRNCLFQGRATKFLKAESRTKVFWDATGRSLNQKTMRDREFVNRFCAFQVLQMSDYRGDMDDFLALCLQKMNQMEPSDLDRLATQFRQGLSNNFKVFGKHAFRKHQPGQQARNVLNASLWDVMATGLSRYERGQVQERAKHLRKAMHGLMGNYGFIDAISRGTSSTYMVKERFRLSRKMLMEVFRADPD